MSGEQDVSTNPDTAGPDTSGGPGGREASRLLSGVDIGLVVADMDGTLLDPAGEVPERTRRVLARLAERGVVFSPASGRQYATLRELFDEADDDTVFIAENGTVVVRGGAVLSTAPLPGGVAADVVAAVRRSREAGGDLGLVVCCPETAYVERSDEAFVTEVSRYYRALEVVPDLTAVCGDDGSGAGAGAASSDREPIKLAVFDFREVAAGTAEMMQGFAGRAQVVVSGHHWVDVMAPGIDKGVAVRRLQDTLGIGPERTAAFGDYLNDLQMLDAAHWSFAMAGAHPEVLERARFRAPSNAENGVAQVLEGLEG